MGFVIGRFSIMKVILSNHTFLSGSKAEVLLPVPHNVIVTPGHSAGKAKIIDASDTQHIRNINRCMFEQSVWTAGRSHHLLESLAHLHKRQWY